MSEQIPLIKDVYSKQQFNNTVDTSFSELTTGTAATADNTQEPVTTVEEFFNQYNSLFYIIPKTGLNSHQQLIDTSSTYVGNDAVNVEIEALIQEVNGLRETVLEQQQLIFNLTNTTT